jgi:KTSC domain
MKHTPLDSSMISSAGYDPKTQTLEVEFNSGEVYCYLDVEQEVFDGLLAADSKGRYMNGNIIDCYETRHVIRARRGRR